MNIREHRDEEIQVICALHEIAFGDEEGSVIAELVMDLFNDPSAAPYISLVAMEGERMVGHIFYSHTMIREVESVSASLLAPLAVHPDEQSKGIGGQLIREGLRNLKDRGVDLVFVLGYPDYYQKFGFRPAGALGLQAPYEILVKNADAWMVLELREGIIGTVTGTMSCPNALDQTKYWVE